MSHFEHVLVPSTAPFTLLLLHGTGGDQNGLLDIGRSIAPNATLLSPKGKVNEGGATRWFRRFGEGVFDEADIKLQAADLASFLQETVPAGTPVIALGYSNGANMGAALMSLYPETLAALVMWRGMKVFQSDLTQDLTGKRVLMLNGTNDPFAPADSASEQAGRFREAGAETQLEISQAGHGLSSLDVDITKRWLAETLSSWHK